MYEWLEEELRRIKTRRFHVVDGPASDELKAAIVHSGLPAPASYREFIFCFGNAKLYRQLDGYLVGVLASPREEVSQEGEVLCVLVTATLIMPTSDTCSMEWTKTRQCLNFTKAASSRLQLILRRG